ncbi:hypothetical protein TNCV_4548601 [Trichonephila clavipes]|nr:hypothetical protein TNCV_4548601 [Trichonephila clavipes]
MARRIGNWSRLEVRAVIRFLWAKNLSVSDIRESDENSRRLFAGTSSEESSVRASMLSDGRFCNKSKILED